VPLLVLWDQLNQLRSDPLAATAMVHE